MRAGQLFMPTLKETPSEAEIVSHRLMLRAGMMRKLAAGIYTYLPLGLRVIQKISQIIREEMNRAGAQELLMPMVLPSELWKESGRWDLYGKELLRFEDRKHSDFCLGPTHEEVITDVVRREIRSYRQLPLNLYQIQTKFRDEIRPRFGLMRGREFLMKDAYSFHRDEADAERGYWEMHEAYARIFTRCGLAFRAVEADTGAIGGSFSHEFMVLAESGEDAIAACEACDYAANVEKAESRHHGLAVGWEAMAPAQGQLRKGTGPAPSSAGKAPKPMERVNTPGQRTVEEVTRFLAVPATQLVKTIIVMADGSPVAALVRGDHELNELKVKNVLGCHALVMADPAAVERVTGAPAGFAGPVDLNGVRIVADLAVQRMANFVVGANAPDAHYVNVNHDRDFPVASFADLRRVQDGDPCPRCQEGRLRIHRGIEVGHIFKLGTKYSEALGATCLDEQGGERPLVMGCYGIGVGRTAAAAIEQNHDEQGIVWPLPIAPFAVAVLPLNMDHRETAAEAEALYRALGDAGVEVLLDDRNERAGVKFKDADLVGHPFQIIVGERSLAKGNVEIKDRRTGKSEQVPKGSAAALLVDRVRISVS